MKAWYFSANDCKLRYDDGRLIKAGITHKVDCEPVLCKSGLHASKKILDALSYAPGTIVWMVELKGNIVKGNDKCVATERKYLWKVDADEILREFARWCALEVIHLWDAPDIVREYLETGNEEIRSAARTDAMTSASAAAEASTWADAMTAAEASTWAAASAAAETAESAAAETAFIEQADNKLEQMIRSAYEQKG